MRDRLSLLVNMASFGVLAVVLAGSSAQVQSQSTPCDPACVHGSCVPVFNSPDAYECNCTATGFSGQACDLSSNSSAAPFSPAACPAGLSGPYCNVSTAASPSTSSSPGCPDVPCGNGNCLPVPDSPEAYQCECFPGYRLSGQVCVSSSAGNASSPSASDGCSNACVHGTCVADTDGTSYHCKCSTGFGGQFCSTQAPGPNAAPARTSSMTQSSPERHTGSIKGWAVFLICLAVVAVLVLAGGIGILIYRRRGTRKTFVRFNESNFEAQNVEVLGNHRGGSSAPHK